jgi:hypothetical protein
MFLNGNRCLKAGMFGKPSGFDEISSEIGCFEAYFPRQPFDGSLKS